MHQLKIITASTRPGRKGPLMAQWIYDIAVQHKEFETELIDLAVVNLPFIDEPNHPRFQKYEHQHTKDWSARINASDAFIIVTPEYNFGFPAPLKNALDFLYKEWNYKPVAFVSYGGVGAGTRSVQMLKQVVTAMQMMPIAESINIPFFTKYITDDKFVADEALNKTADTVLAELARWTTAMKGLRQ